MLLFLQLFPFLEVLVGPHPKGYLFLVSPFIASILISYQDWFLEVYLVIIFTALYGAATISFLGIISSSSHWIGIGSKSIC